MLHLIQQHGSERDKGTERFGYFVLWGPLCGEVCKTCLENLKVTKCIMKISPIAFEQMSALGLLVQFLPALHYLGVRLIENNKLNKTRASASLATKSNGDIQNCSLAKRQRTAAVSCS